MRVQGFTLLEGFRERAVLENIFFDFFEKVLTALQSFDQLEIFPRWEALVL